MLFYKLIFVLRDICDTYNKSFLANGSRSGRRKGGESFPLATAQSRSFASPLCCSPRSTEKVYIAERINTSAGIWFAGCSGVMVITGEKSPPLLVWKWRRKLRGDRRTHLPVWCVPMSGLEPNDGDSWSSPEPVEHRTGPRCNKVNQPDRFGSMRIVTRESRPSCVLFRVKLDSVSLSGVPYTLAWSVLSFEDQSWRIWSFKRKHAFQGMIQSGKILLSFIIYKGTKNY